MATLSLSSRCGEQSHKFEIKTTGTVKYLEKFHKIGRSNRMAKRPNLSLEQLKICLKSLDKTIELVQHFPPVPCYSGKLIPFYGNLYSVRLNNS